MARLSVASILLILIVLVSFQMSALPDPTLTTIVSILLLLMVLVLFQMWALGRIDGTANAANRKLDLLMKHSGMNVQELAVREVQVMLRDDRPFNKIAAIKQYREVTGAGLAEAKAAVERIQRDAQPA